MDLLLYVFVWFNDNKKKLNYKLLDYPDGNMNVSAEWQSNLKLHISTTSRYHGKGKLNECPFRVLCQSILWE